MQNSGNNQLTFLFTVDVEDWFQVENHKRAIVFDSWDQRELRVERNTHRILDLLDECGSKAATGIQAINKGLNIQATHAPNNLNEPNKPNKPNKPNEPNSGNDLHSM